MKYIDYYISKRKYLNNDDIKFMQWINKIEDIIMRDLDVELLDLPDEDYMMMFYNEYKPIQVVSLIKLNLLN